MLVRDCLFCHSWLIYARPYCSLLCYDGLCWSRICYAGPCWTLLVHACLCLFMLVHAVSYLSILLPLPKIGISWTMLFPTLLYCCILSIASPCWRLYGGLCSYKSSLKITLVKLFIRLTRCFNCWCTFNQFQSFFLFALWSTSYLHVCSRLKRGLELYP